MSAGRRARAAWANLGAGAAVAAACAVCCAPWLVAAAGTVGVGASVASLWIPGLAAVAVAAFAAVWFLRRRDAAVRPVAAPVLLAAAAAVALLVNLAAYAAARVAGVGFDVVSFIGNRPETVGPRAIAVMTLVPWLAGGVVLVLTRRWAAGRWPWLGWAGVILALVTVPFFNQAEPATKVTLAVMHLAAGGLWFGAVRSLIRQT